MPPQSRAQPSLEEVARFLESLRPELVTFLAKQLAPEDAKDTASQLIYKMLARAKRRKRFRLKPVEELRKYAYGAAKKMASSAHREAQRRLERDEAFRALAPRAEPLLPDAIVAASELLALLPEELAEPYKMCELEGLSHEEAAEQLGIPVGTLKSRLLKARRLLARENAKREIFRNRNHGSRS